MPKINTASIEGFDGMTAEQKLNALLSLDVPESVDLSQYVKKELFDKKASETAEWKRKHDALLTEEDKRKQDEAEANAKRDEELETLRKEKTISAFTAKYLALGYDADLAKDTAEAMASGDTERVFANGEKHKAELEKKIKADLIKGTPHPEGAIGSAGTENAGVETAKKIGQAKAEADKYAHDVLARYKNRGKK